MSSIIKKQTLQQQLDHHKANFLQKAPVEKIQAYDEGIAAVVQSGIVDKALKKGDKAIPFTLPNALNQSVSLSSYLEKGPVVLSWYRGGWCPYCSLTLRALQQALTEIKALGAHLLALTPELPGLSLNTKEKHALEFEVLSDQDNKVAEQYGLVFKLTPEVAAYYKAAFDLETYNGNNSDELPLAATYVIDQKGLIRFAFLDADYRRRAEPAEILKVLEEL